MDEGVAEEQEKFFTRYSASGIKGRTRRLAELHAYG
jgi:hypothetical protein